MKISDLRPSDFVSFPCCSYFGKYEAEEVAQRIMQTRGILGDSWSDKLSWEHYCDVTKIKPDNEWEKKYFLMVYPKIDTLEKAWDFSLFWCAAIRKKYGKNLAP